MHKKWENFSLTGRNKHHNKADGILTCIICIAQQTALELKEASGKESEKQIGALKVLIYILI